MVFPTPAGRQLLPHSLRIIMLIVVHTTPNIFHFHFVNHFLKVFMEQFAIVQFTLLEHIKEFCRGLYWFGSRLFYHIIIGFFSLICGFFFGMMLQHCWISTNYFLCSNTRDYLKREEENWRIKIKFSEFGRKIKLVWLSQCLILLFFLNFCFSLHLNSLGFIKLFDSLIFKFNKTRKLFFPTEKIVHISALLIHLLSFFY